MNGLCSNLSCMSFKPKIEDDLKSEYNEDYLQNEGNLKNEDDKKKIRQPKKIKTT